MSEKGLAKIQATDIAPIDELKGWAALAVKAQIIPSNMNVFQAMAIVQAGKEMGLQPLQSLRSMAFIKGRLTMSVQLQLAMAKNKGVTMDDPSEDDGVCEVTLHRSKESVTCKYTREDAKKAGLIAPGGNWDKYERQMLRWRAIGDALRLIAPDLTMNLLSPEEAVSIEPLAPLQEDALKALEEKPAKEAHPPASAAAGGQSLPPHPHSPSAPKGDDEDALREHLFTLVKQLAKEIGGDEKGWPGILHDLTMNKEGKFGKTKLSELTIDLIKKDGTHWSPLKAAISKAEAELERIAKEWAG